MQAFYGELSNMKKNILLAMALIFFLLGVKEASAAEKSGELQKNEVWVPLEVEWRWDLEVQYYL